MKLNEFRIRDPYILFDGGRYYMYGTTRFCDIDDSTDYRGFDVYVSKNLVDFDG